MNVFISKEIQRQSDYLPDEAASQNVSCHYQTHLPLHSTHSIEPVTRTQTPHHIWSYDLMALYNTHNPFNGPFSRTTRVSRYQKGKTNLDFTEARDSDWQWHQLGHIQVCTSLQTDNHASTPPLSYTYTCAKNQVSMSSTSKAEW